MLNFLAKLKNSFLPIFPYKLDTRYFFYKKLGFLARGSEIGLNFLAILKSIELRFKLVKLYESTHPNKAFLHVTMGGGKEKVGQIQQRS